MNQVTQKVRLIAATALISAGIAFAPPAYASGWEQQVSKLVLTNQKYPRSAQVRGEEGKATVKVAIDGAGAITGVELVSSSGSSILDKEATKLFESLGSLPTPPDAAPRNIVFPLVWSLN